MCPTVRSSSTDREREREEKQVRTIRTDPSHTLKLIKNLYKDKVAFTPTWSGTFSFSDESVRRTRVCIVHGQVPKRFPHRHIDGPWNPLCVRHIYVNYHSYYESDGWKMKMCLFVSLLNNPTPGSVPNDVTMAARSTDHMCRDGNSHTCCHLETMMCCWFHNGFAKLYNAPLLPVSSATASQAPGWRLVRCNHSVWVAIPKTSYVCKTQRRHTECSFTRAVFLSLWESLRAVTTGEEPH